MREECSLAVSLIVSEELGFPLIFVSALANSDGTYCLLDTVLDAGMNKVWCLTSRSYSSNEKMTNQEEQIKFGLQYIFKFNLNACFVNSFIVYYLLCSLKCLASDGVLSAGFRCFLHVVDQHFTSGALEMMCTHRRPDPTPGDSVSVGLG